MGERTQTGAGWGRSRTPWPPGTPNWVSLASDDPALAVGFYAELFGWECEQQGPYPYWVCRLDGTDVSGIGPKKPGTEQLPDQWTTYLATDQLEHTIAAITGRGGRVLTEPREIEGHGRMAILQDPVGAAFGLWQATESIGVSRTGDPGSLVWSEALSHSYKQTQDFYAGVFGYRTEEIGDAGPRYAALYLGDRPVAGAGELHAEMPAETEPHWLPYFAVADADATVAATRAAGGQLMGGPYDTDFGRCATLADPQGARFAVIQLADAN